MKRLSIVVGAVAMSLAACSSNGDDGTAGPAGPAGPAGAPGSPGAAGPAGAGGATGTKTASEDVASLQLPGPAFYPQAITSAADGAIFVSSIGTGEIVKFAAGSLRPTVIVPKADPQILTPGLVVDTDTLWACTVRFAAPSFQQPIAELRSYDLTGKLVKAYPLPNQGSSMCEEPTVGPNRRIYVTDAFRGEIYVLDSPGASLRSWVASESLRPTDPNVLPFGAHGIAWDGGGNVFVANFNASRLVRIPIGASGAAGIPSDVVVSPALVQPEALRMLDAKTFVLTQSAGNPSNAQLTKIALTGDNTAAAVPLRTGLKWATAVTRARGSFWIAEGQIDHFLDGSKPQLPFQVERLDAE